MANINKVKVKGTQYDIEDFTARNGLTTKQDVLINQSNIKSINGTTLLGSGDYKINLSECNNDSEFITKIVNDLENYYNKTKIDEMISAIPKFKIEVVDILPTENISDTTVYLVPDPSSETNVYTEWIHVSGKWEQLGTQTVDLKGYATESWVEEKGYDTVSNVNSKLSAKADTNTVNAALDNKLDKVSEQEKVYATDKFTHQTTIQYNEDAIGGGLAKRTSSGTLKVADPVNNDEAATKLYVDNVTTAKQDRIAAGNGINIAEDGKTISVNMADISKTTMTKHTYIGDIYNNEFYQWCLNTPNVVDGALFKVETETEVPEEAIGRGFPKLQQGSVVYGYFYNGMDESPIVIMTDKGNYKITDGVGELSCVALGGSDIIANPEIVPDMPKLDSVGISGTNYTVGGDQMIFSDTPVEGATPLANIEAGGMNWSLGGGGGSSGGGGVVIVDELPEATEEEYKKGLIYIQNNNIYKCESYKDYTKKPGIESIYHNEWNFYGRWCCNGSKFYHFYKESAYVYDVRTKEFKTLTTSMSDLSSCSHYTVTYCPDNNMIYIIGGTNYSPYVDEHRPNKSIYQFDLSNNSVKKVGTIPFNVEGESGAKYLEARYYKKYIYIFFKAPSGNGKQLYRFNPIDNSCVLYSNLDSTKYLMFDNIMFDENDNIYYGSINANFKFNIETKKETFINNPKELIKDNEIYGLRDLTYCGDAKSSYLIPYSENTIYPGPLYQFPYAFKFNSANEKFVISYPLSKITIMNQTQCSDDIVYKYYDKNLTYIDMKNSEMQIKYRYKLLSGDVFIGSSYDIASANYDNYDSFRNEEWYKWIQNSKGLIQGINSSGIRLKVSVINKNISNFNSIDAIINSPTTYGNFSFNTKLRKETPDYYYYFTRYNYIKTSSQYLPEGSINTNEGYIELLTSKTEEKTYIYNHCSTNESPMPTAIFIGH